MPVHMTCDCGANLQIKDELLGKEVHCPACRRALVVRSPESAEEEAIFHLKAEPPPSAPVEPLVPVEPAPRRPLARGRGMNHRIIGRDLQLLEIELEPGETVIAEAGAMMYMEEDIDFTATLGDGSRPNQGFFEKLASAGKRWLTGESIFLTRFTNQGLECRRVAFAAPYPGKIIAIDLAELGGELICQKGAFLCATLGTTLDFLFQQKLAVGLFGGEGFILQRIVGQGQAFLHACGGVVRRELDERETLRVDSGCLVAFSPGVNYDVQQAGGLKSMLFGGEGLFLVTLTGPGTVWLQSLPFGRLAHRIVGNASSWGGSHREEGSLLGGLTDLLSGA